MHPPRVIIGVILAAALAGSAATAVASPALADVDTGSISGTVRDTRGAVMANAEITVYPPDTSGNFVARTHTDAAGKFRVPALEEGGYKIFIGLGGWFEWAPGQTADADAAVVYPVVAGRNTVAKSVVTAAGVVTGRVTTPSGRPASGVAVTADDEEHARAWNTTTAADGTYTLRVAPGTSYVISFTDGHLQQFSPRTVDRAEARRYTVKSGRTIRVSDRLLPAATLTGRLVDAAGAPVEAAEVHFINMNAFELQTTTDADGRYRFDKLAPGPVKVWFRTADGREQWAYQKLSYDEADVITLSLATVTTVNDQLLPLVGSR